MGEKRRLEITKAMLQAAELEIAGHLFSWDDAHEKERHEALAAAFRAMLLAANDALRSAGAELSTDRLS